MTMQNNFNNSSMKGCPWIMESIKEISILNQIFSDSELLKIENLGLNYEIIERDISSFYRNQNDPFHKDYKSNIQLRNATCANSSVVNYQTPVNFDVHPANNFGGYYTYSQLLQELDDMVTLYPNLITSKADISTFITEGTPNNVTTPPIGGNKIQWVKISDNPNDNAEGETTSTVYVDTSCS